MKRSTFRRQPSLRQQRREGADTEREPKPWAVALSEPAERGGSTYAGGTTASVPKGVKARPGKGTPTADDRAWMDAIVAYGCIACRMEGWGFRPAAVHHILRGGFRLGHKFTLPLCDPGHHQSGAGIGMISRHPWKARFEDRYGDEWALLSTLQGVLKKQPDGSYTP